MTRSLQVVLAAGLVLSAPVGGQGPAPPGPGPAPARRQQGIVLLAADDFTRPYAVAIREAFSAEVAAAADPPALYVESLDALRFSRPVHLDGVSDWLTRKYAGTDIGLVVAIGEPVVEFLATRRGAAWPGVPVFYVESGSMGVDTSTLTGVTGLIVESAVAPALSVIRTVLPETRLVVQLVGSSDVERDRGATFGTQVEAAGLSFEVLADGSLEQWSARLSTLSDGAVVYLPFPTVDADGRTFEAGMLCEHLVPVTPVPVFDLRSDNLGCGVIGGLVRDWHKVGQRMAALALSQLNGETGGVHVLPVGQYTTLAFDSRQLARFGIPESRLPPGSQVLFRPPSLWRDYRAEMIAVGASLLLQALLIAALLAQRARRRAVEVRNEATLRAMPDMVFLLTRDGRFLSAHAPGSADLLRPPSEFVGRRVPDVLPPAVATKIMAAFARLDDREPSIVHYDLTIDGDERHFEARLVPCDPNQVLALVRNVTAARQAEAALEEGRERYSLATVAGGVGVWDWDLSTNAVYVDPFLKRLLGYRDDEIRNHMDVWGALVHPDDQALVALRVQEHLDGRTDLFEVEHRMRHRDGSIRWFLARGSATRVDGRAVRIVGTDTDITAQKATEAALHEAQAELGRLSRLTALGQFAASIAHEVRQPLTAMIANAQAGLRWLRTGDDPGFSRTEGALAEVLTAARRADLVIRRMGELFRNRPVRKLALDVNRAIEEVAALVAPRLRAADVILALELDADLPIITADRIQIQQVLLNLLTNALDALEDVAPSRRRVVIATRSEPGAGIEVTVTDAGVGFAGVEMDRLFAPTYTTKPTGTGVGLAICRSVIESHGGRIRATANPEGGATFAFSLPLQAGVRTTSPVT